MMCMFKWKSCLHNQDQTNLKKKLKNILLLNHHEQLEQSLQAPYGTKKLMN